MSRATATLRPPPLRLRAGAFALACAVFFVGLLAASPRLHAELHGDCHHAAESGGHVCAVTLFAAGVEPVVAPVLLPVRNERVVETVRATSAALRPECGAHRLPPACGPPRG